MHTTNLFEESIPCIEVKKRSAFKQTVIFTYVTYNLTLLHKYVYICIQ